jgi:hypothetical protein
MALLAWYEKVRETTAQVEYRFGYPELDRLLVIAKADRSCRATGGMSDATVQTLAGKLIFEALSEGSWPERGTLAA